VLEKRRPTGLPPAADSIFFAVQAKRIHHLGVAVEDLDEAVDTYRRLFGAEVEGRDTLESQGVEAVAVRMGESRVELLASLGEETPVGKFLAKRGPGMHHVAYEVDDLPQGLSDLAGQGVQLIDDVPHRGLFGLQVAFVHPDSVHGVLAELVTVG
jgi:methylmalonyl-CoA/ethylmalonyl-CoA epimerase